jgi:hypothetical protein
VNIQRFTTFVSLEWVPGYEDKKLTARFIDWANFFDMYLYELEGHISAHIKGVKPIPSEWSD